MGTGCRLHVKADLCLYLPVQPAENSLKTLVKAPIDLKDMGFSIENDTKVGFRGMPGGHMD